MTWRSWGGPKVQLPGRGTLPAAFSAFQGRFLSPLLYLQPRKNRAALSSQVKILQEEPRGILDTTSSLMWSLDTTLRQHQLLLPYPALQPLLLDQVSNPTEEVLHGQSLPTFLSTCPPGLLHAHLLFFSQHLYAPSCHKAFAHTESFASTVLPSPRVSAQAFLLGDSPQFPWLVKSSDYFLRAAYSSFSMQGLQLSF